jgi:hypothetical protein
MAISYGTSWTDICNRALGRLGKGRIDDLVSGGDMALYCNQFLGEAIETVLSARSWYGFRARAQLARSTTAPAYGYNYAYALPADCVNLVGLDTLDDWTREGAFVLTDAEEVYALYVPRPDTPASLPGYLKRAIGLHLAFLLTTPLASSDQLKAIIGSEVNAAMQDAIAADERSNGLPGIVASYTEER